MSTPTSPLILVAEDETKLARVLTDYLSVAGYATHVITDGSSVVPWVRNRSPAAILLDVMLPGRDGFEICRAIRAFSSVPILMVTARVEELDRLLGLELGADDYICKPFSPREVVARLKAVLRRAGPDGDRALEQDRGLLELDAASLRVHAGKGTVQLTAVEFHLLEAMHAQPGRIFTRDQLMDRIYDDRRVVSDRTIDSHVKKLRRKLATLLPGHALVHSVYGAGYRYEPRADAP